MVLSSNWEHLLRGKSRICAVNRGGQTILLGGQMRNSDKKSVGSFFHHGTRSHFKMLCKAASEIFRVIEPHFISYF